MAGLTQGDMLWQQSGPGALGLAPAMAGGVNEIAGLTLGAAAPLDPDVIMAHALAAAHALRPPVSDDWLNPSHDAFRLSARATLPMPDQSLTAPFVDPAAPGTQTMRGTLVLRALTLGFPLIVTLGLGGLSLGWFARDGHLSAVEGALVAMTVFAFYWVALSVPTATLGLFWRAAAAPTAARQGLTTAILLPMYGEPALPTISHAVTLLSGLSRAQILHRFDLHILSDTRDLAAAQAEAAMARLLAARHPGLVLHYRRRAQNSDFKSGNVRAWVQAEGFAYDAMLVLDADSVMTPEAVTLMADTLATDPSCGLVQTMPRVAPGTTVWQHLQSFASEVYGTNLGRGFALWTGDEGNFLGHNALVRTRAFAASAGLPHLTGRAPRGGVILSHDFVEAALLRRAGWGVRMLPQARGSFEDTPATLPGYVRRDTRWCQGNMQHLRLLAVPGLHLLSRFHLAQGAMVYLSSVWWLALLMLWTLHGVFSTGPLPVLSAMPPAGQWVLSGAVALMLVVPKLVGIAGYLIQHQRSRTRPLRHFARWALAEAVLSVLLAPTLMIHQVRAVLRTLARVNGGWAPHSATRPGLVALARFHGTETALGLGLLILAARGDLTPWLWPIGISLSLAFPLSWLVQREMRPADAALSLVEARP